MDIIDDISYGQYYDHILYDYKEYGNDLKWEMKDGTLIKIKNMTTSHIINCINMMNRKEINQTRKAWIKIFEDVIITRRIDKIIKIKNNIQYKSKKNN